MTAAKSKPKVTKKVIKLDRRHFNRLNDRFFKFLFANPKHKWLLIWLLNLILANVPEGAERLPPIKDLTYRDREATPTHRGGKIPRFDVIATTEDGQVFHIEVQVEKDENIAPRVLNYGARHVVMRTGEGEEYSADRVVVIVLANFRLFPKLKDYYSLQRILDVKTGKWEMRGLEFHFVDLTKLRRRGGLPQTELERLLYYLGNIGGEKMMEALAKEDPRIAKLMQLEDLFLSDPDLVEEYLAEERARQDYQAELKACEARGEARGKRVGRNEGIKLGRDEGIKLGRDEGREEALFSTARQLLQMGVLTLKQIAQATGLSIADLEAMDNLGRAGG